MFRRAMHSLSVRLQSVAVFLSLVGVSFGIKSYVHVRDQFGQEASHDFFNDLIFQIIIALIVNLLVAVILYRIATRPVRQLRDCMHELSEDNLHVAVPYTHDRTEIGSMARNLEHFKKVLLERRERAKQDQKALEEKSRQQSHLEQRIREFDATISNALKTVSSAVNQIFDASRSVLTFASNTDHSVKGVGHSIDSTFANARSMTTAAEQLSVSIHGILSQARQSSELSEAAVNQTRKADLIAKDLTRAANEVGDVITLIGDIAAQINLLALNASIEAARAGAAGKGFAVVASEVKSLAGETTTATEKISEQIKEIQNVAHVVAEALAAVGATIVDMNAISASISTAVQEQGNATGEIAHTIQQVTQLVGGISGGMEKVQQSSVETESAAHQVNDAAQSFSIQSQKLEQDVSTFLSQIRE